MSSIIKGQRIRNESPLELKSLSVRVAPEHESKELTTDIQGEKVDIQVQIQEAKAKAEMIINKAKEEALKIIEDGQKKIDEELAIALEQAQEKGYSTGYTNGYEKGQLEAQGLIEEGKQIVASAITEKKQLLDKIEPEIIEMVIAICNKLIDEEINFNPETILILIRKTLGEIHYDTLEISIKVSPHQYDYVLENKDFIIEDYANSSDVAIWKDASLTEGACIVETHFGSVECNITEGFAEIQKQMRLICDKR